MGISRVALISVYIHASATTPADLVRLLCSDAWSFTSRTFPPRQRRPSPQGRWFGVRINSFEVCSAFTRVPAWMLADPHNGPSYRSASADSSPPPPLRLLLAGAKSCQVGITPTENQNLITAHAPARVADLRVPKGIQNSQTWLLGPRAYFETNTNWRSWTIAAKTKLERIAKAAESGSRAGFPARPPHHRTCGSAYGGSTKDLSPGPEEHQEGRFGAGCIDHCFQKHRDQTQGWLLDQRRCGTSRPGQ